MSSSWFQNFKDGLYAAEQFFMEKKPGQYPPEISSIQQFIAIVLRNNVEAQVGEQFRSILTNDACLSIMVKGLLLKPNKDPVPGEFYTKPIASISIQHDEAIFTLSINGMLKAITEHGRRTDSLNKSKQVSLYIVSVFSQAFSTYITQVGASFMPQPTRNSIVGNTIIEVVPIPYNQGQRASAIKDVVTDAFATPEIRAYLEKQIGVTGTRTLAAGIENFDGSKIGGLQEGLTKALTTKKAAPIYDAIMDLVTSTAGNVQADDGVDPQDQG